MKTTNWISRCARSRATGGLLALLVSLSLYTRTGDTLEACSQHPDDPPIPEFPLVPLPGPAIVEPMGFTSTDSGINSGTDTCVCYIKLPTSQGELVDVQIINHATGEVVIDLDPDMSFEAAIRLADNNDMSGQWQGFSGTATAAMTGGDKMRMVLTFNLDDTNYSVFADNLSEAKIGTGKDIGGGNLGHPHISEFGEPWLPMETADLNAIPTVSEWGLILLALLLVTAAAVLAVRLRSRAVQEGLTFPSFDHPALFDAGTYAKALLVTLCLAGVGVLTAGWYYGPLPVRDIVGTLLGATIVAYLAHLWMIAGPLNTAE